MEFSDYSYGEIRIFVWVFLKFSGEDTLASAPDATIADIASWVCRGGWPAMRGMPDRSCTRLNSQYLGSVFDEDAPRRGLSQCLARSWRGTVAPFPTFGDSAKRSTSLRRFNCSKLRMGCIWARTRLMAVSVAAPFNGSDGNILSSMPNEQDK